MDLYEIRGAGKNTTFDAVKKYAEDATIRFHVLIIEAGEGYRNFAILLGSLFYQLWLLPEF